MEKLTKQQRHEAYKKALEILNDDPKKYTHWFNDCICHCLMNAKFEKETEYNSETLYFIFKEFYLFRPEDIKEPYWFENKLEREIVLDLCIEMTK